VCVCVCVHARARTTDGWHIVNVYMSNPAEPLPILYRHCKHYLLTRTVCSGTSQGHLTLYFLCLILEYFNVLVISETVAMVSTT